jgi:ABC-2 type transport system permease protein
MSGDRVRRILGLARHDLRILRSDPAFLVIFTLMPLAYMAFTQGAFGAAMSAANPGVDVNGAEQVVPGAAVLFSGFLVGNLGFAVFREHGWCTWDRLRASSLSTADLLIGKAITPMLSLAIQLTVMLGGGALLFDLHVAGPMSALVAVALALAVMEVALGFMLLAICRSVLQLNAATNVGAMFLGGLGGAVTPVDSLPGWAQAIAPFTPTYWAMQGFTDVILGGAGISQLGAPLGVLGAFSLAFVAVAAMRFRVEDSKLSWA